MQKKHIIAFLLIGLSGCSNLLPVYKGGRLAALDMFTEGCRQEGFTHSLQTISGDQEILVCRNFAGDPVRYFCLDSGEDQWIPNSEHGSLQYTCNR